MIINIILGISPSVRCGVLKMPKVAHLTMLLPYLSCFARMNVDDSSKKIEDVDDRLWVNTTFSHMEKDDELVAFMITNKVAYTNLVCVAWDPKHENHTLSKVCQLKEI